MARIVYSGLVTEIKGSIGGTTFQSNRSGYIVRNKQYKGPVRSVGNVEAGRAFAIASRRWSLLSSAQQSDYNTMASSYPYTDLWGNTKTLTGFQWFMASTNNQFRVDGVGLPLAPAGSPVRVVPPVSYFFSGSDWTIAIPDWNSTNADYAACFASAPLRSVTPFNRLNYRFLNLFDRFYRPYYYLSDAYGAVFGLDFSDLRDNTKSHVNVLLEFFKAGEAGHSSFHVIDFYFNF